MFNLIVSDRLEALAEALADHLASTWSSNPFEDQIVVVPNQGMERWLSFRLSEKFGICASISFPFPVAFLRDITAALLPSGKEEMVWSAGVVEWALMDILDALPTPLLSNNASQLSRRGLARILAERFDEYAVHRPDLVARWRTSQADPPDAEERWQARLWRHLAHRLSGRHPAELLVMAIRQLESSAPAVSLPAQVRLFGLSTLPPLHREVFRALARHTAVTVFALNPCREMWFEASTPRRRLLIQAREAELGLPPDALHTDDAPMLLALNGSSARHHLAELYEYAGWQPIERWSNAEASASGALGVLQRNIVEYRAEPPEGQASVPLPSEDCSLRIHVCHSPRREVEVLKDHLLDFLQRLPGLVPRDIVVMAPDIEPYAPHIETVFGAEPPRLLFTIADRSPLRRGHVVDAVRRLLRLPDGPFSASELFELLSLPPVRRRFGLAEADLEIIRSWLDRTGIRRGDGGDGTSAVPFTWRWGLERLAIGAAVHLPPLELAAGMLPTEAGEAGLLATLWDVYEAAWKVRRELAGPLPAGEWARRLLDAIECFVAPAMDETAEVRALRDLVRQWSGDAAAAGVTRSIDLPTARAMIEDRLDPTILATPYLGPGIVCCNLLPMRSIPFRVVALLGMNDDAFPRNDRVASFDLVRAHPRPGDRSRRQDDRLLFLETLLSARDALHVSYVGRDIRSNESRPPSVCVAELLDAVDRTFAGCGGLPSRRLVVEHPLHPFDVRYYGGEPGRFSFSERHRRATTAASRRAAGPYGSILSLRLDLPPELGTVDLANMARFFRDPVAGFLRLRLGARFPRLEREVDDADPLLPEDSDAGRLLAAWLMESDEALGTRCVPWGPVLTASGALPVGPSGEVARQAAEGARRRWIRRLAPWRVSPMATCAPRDYERDGVRLRAGIPGLRRRGLVRVVPGRRRKQLTAADRIEPWLAHLAMCASAPDGVEQRTVLAADDGDIEWGPIPDAGALLLDWLAAYAEGVRRPLPLWPDCAWEYVASAEGNQDGARDVWRGEFGIRAKNLCAAALFDEAWDPVGDDLLRWAPLLYGPMRNAERRDGAHP